MGANFWKGRKVLITGYEGFVGSWLSRTLLEKRSDVVGLDIKTHRKETILTEDELKQIKIIKGSVENLGLVFNTIKQNDIEVIFHLAARALVGDCLKKPLKTFKTNIQGTWNILEASRMAQCVRTVVIASSDKAYGEHKKLPYREDAPLRGNHPYDVSKSCADLIAQMYYHTFGLPVVIARCGNIYGPGDFNFSRLVPDAVRCALSDKTFLIRSDGKFIRDYVYIEDVVKGYILLVEKFEKEKLAGEAFNFSNEKPISVLTLVKAIYKILQKKPEYKILNKTKYEIMRQYLSSSKARKILGWQPEYNLLCGLRKTISWYERSYMIVSNKL